MSALDLVTDPDALRREAERMREAAANLPPSELLRVRLNAAARELDGTADAIDDLPAAMRADLIEMLRSIEPN
jgi:hypothetical protein